MQPDKNLANGLSLIPVSIVAFGAADMPAERLLGVQSAIAKGVEWLASLRLPQPRPARPALLRPQPTSQGDL